MSVLIKGMEMPKSCIWRDGKCPLLGDDDDCKLQDCQEEWTWQDQYKGCPLSDAPDKNVGDTIYRQAAIDALLEEVRLVDGYYVENDEVINKDDAIEAIRLLPSAQPEQRWIPCSERLPEMGQPVIDDFISLNWLSYASDDIEWVFPRNVTAWMPLPSPWKEGD